MININLLPSAQRRPLIIFDRTLSACIAIIVIEIVTLIGFSAIENMRISRLNDQIAEWGQKVAAEQVLVKEVADLRDQAKELQAKADLLERIKQSPLQLAEILQDVANDTPRTVWLNNIIVSHATLGGSVALQGKTSQYRDVADFMLNLDSSPIFGNATLNSSTQQTEGGLVGGGNVTFSMVGQLNSAVAGQ